MRLARAVPHGEVLLHLCLLDDRLDIKHKFPLLFVRAREEVIFLDVNLGRRVVEQGARLNFASCPERRRRDIVIQQRLDIRPRSHRVSSLAANE